jgi:hypothetical protein
VSLCGRCRAARGVLLAICAVCVVYLKCVCGRRACCAVLSVMMNAVVAATTRVVNSLVAKHRSLSDAVDGVLTDGFAAMGLLWCVQQSRVAVEQHGFAARDTLREIEQIVAGHVQRADRAELNMALQSAASTHFSFDAVWDADELVSRLSSCCSSYDVEVTVECLSAAVYRLGQTGLFSKRSRPASECGDDGEESGEEESESEDSELGSELSGEEGEEDDEEDEEDDEDEEENDYDVCRGLSISSACGKKRRRDERGVEGERSSDSEDMEDAVREAKRLSCVARRGR